MFMELLEYSLPALSLGLLWRARRGGSFSKEKYLGKDVFKFRIKTKNYYDSICCPACNIWNKINTYKTKGYCECLERTAYPHFDFTCSQCKYEFTMLTKNE